MARYRGFFGYLKTEAGRKLVFAGAAVTTVSLFAGNYVPYTFLLGQYRKVIACYENSAEKQVHPKVLKRIEKAFDILQLKPYERKIIKPFTVYGFDVYQAGSTKHRFGGILGIPLNYTYDCEEDIDKQKIRFRSEMIKWESESGKLLKEALILREDEQIFAICRAILQLQTHQVLLNSLFPSVSFMMVYSIGNILNQKLQLLARPMSLRLMLYSILGLFGLGIWSFTTDFNQVQYDAEFDKKLCDLGPEFIEAGARFYDKILKRNIALRQLMGDNTYTVKGNENYLVRHKTLPLTFRKSYFEGRLDELKKKLNPANEANVEAS